jgi:hypothetical protein
MIFRKQEKTLLSFHLPAITLNINELNSLIKRQRWKSGFGKQKEKNISHYVLSTKTT